MTIVAIVTYCFGALYVLMIAAFAVGWLRLRPFSPKMPMKTPVSLVVCCKNEAENLPRLLASIAAQKYPNFEVVFANDHSTDKTAKILDEFCKNHTFATYFSTDGTGKKNALREAVSRATNDIIVCTDADCTLQPTHLQTIAAYFDAENPDLLLGGVRIEAQKSLFAQLQALEFASLIASTAGACALRMPIMCNGANLAFKKSVFIELSGQLCDREISGDDQFLLFAAKRARCRIRFLKAADTIVTTQPQATLGKFVRQRGRWTSKTKSYTDPQTIATACIVFATSVLILADFIGIFFNRCFIAPFAIAFSLKFMADLAILSAFLPFLSQKRLILHAPILSVLYPIYVLSSVFVGFFRKRW
ncbi:MAG: glycosyltransferase [Paludibacteraceae bacterium]